MIVVIDDNDVAIYFISFFNYSFYSFNFLQIIQYFYRLVLFFCFMLDDI